MNTDSSFSIRHINLQFLATKTFKVYTKRTPNILNKLFPLNPELSCSLRNQQTFATRLLHTVHYRSYYLTYLGPNIWERVPSDVKNVLTLKTFNTARKIIFPKPWNIMKSSEIPRKYQLSINFLDKKKSVFCISEKFKTRTFPYSGNIVFYAKENIILNQLFESKEDRISHHRKVQNKNFTII